MKNKKGIEHSPLMQKTVDLLQSIEQHKEELSKMTPGDKDKEFLKNWEDLTYHLYQLRYMCEEHYESSIAFKIEEICIKLTGVICQLGMDANLAAGENE